MQIIRMVAVVVTLMLLAGCGAGDQAVAETTTTTTAPTTTTEVERTRFEEALRIVGPPACDENRAPICLPAVVGDEGHTLILDQRGERELEGMSIEDIVDILVTLDVPESMIALMDSTRALDGMQTAEWDGITATWTYHPDSGLNLILTDEG